MSSSHLWWDVGVSVFSLLVGFWAGWSLRMLQVRSRVHPWVYDTLKGTEHDLDSIEARLRDALSGKRGEVR
jgi:hypothetical protein